ncbi:BlaI/MecI/CopY family transcriptional regulator [Schlesneria paludicola]|uniref:BlaI/MecI/CopY family transcriptional regulator n=1 Tax=Schlesneria paludicola TaxID=360056 RepID=UPI000299F1C2|nr:BlaI/MecI/CopY family transcriptional regulator [Schlesneria paludicola]
MTGPSPLELGKRERQLVEAVYRLGEASVAQVLAELTDPPSYSSVRAMLSILVEKKILRQRHEGKRYLYRPATSRETARRSAFHQLLRTFFSGEPTAALATLLDLSAGQLTTDDLDRMKQLIEKTRQENG